MFVFFRDELLQVDELIQAIYKLKKVPDAFKMERIVEVLEKIDVDKDGAVKVEDLLKVCFLLYSIQIKYLSLFINCTHTLPPVFIFRLYFNSLSLNYLKDFIFQAA